MLWRCSVCAFLHEGSAAPEKCRRCGATKDKFYALTPEDAKKIYQVDRTNDILMEIVGLSMRINELAKEGIEIALSAEAVDSFKKIQDGAWIVKSTSKAVLKKTLEGDKP